MPKRIIVSCCYSEGRPDYYKRFAERLGASLEKWAPDVPRKIFWDSWPPGSPSHSKHHYAFKWFAMEWARQQGAEQAVWLDAGSEALGPLDPIWRRLDRDGHALLVGADCLGTWISDDALAHFGTTRDEAMGMKLAGGCLVGIDFRNERAMKFYEEWGYLAEHSRLFMCGHTDQSIKDGVMRSVLMTDGPDSRVISTDPRVQGHRSDEACFSIMMKDLGMEGMPLTEWNSFMRTY